MYFILMKSYFWVRSAQRPVLMSNSPLWGYSGDRVEMVVKMHSGTVLGDEFAAMLKMCPPKQSHNVLDGHLDPVSRATSKWPILLYRTTGRTTGGHFVCACVNMSCWSATEAFPLNCLRSLPEFAGCFLELYWVLRSTNVFFNVSRYFYDESEFIVASLLPLRGQSFLS